ncbi:MAG: proton-conducting membrane transporter [Actinobacteria bacterium HGW-Actinobacteria-7]|nr:MAG: proton-conducting membrane transporter [Actinobacteria bacterium HGW-Actinobacteria-7]
MSPTVALIPFAILGLLTLGCAAMMLFSRNVVHAAFWMLASMVSTAGLYLLLSAEFLALVQLLVYAGAVAVLVLFVVMLTLRRRADAVRPIDFSLPALALAVSFAALACFMVLSLVPAYPDSLPSVAPGVTELGLELFSTWVLPFELASLILLVALVGAVWWSGGVKRS